jgi:hypothetical protein
LTAVVLALLAWLAVPAATAGPVSDDWQRQSAQWFENVEPGGTVRVVNPLGNIYARFGGYEARVEVLATLQQKGATPPAEVSLITTRTRLDITVRPGAGDPGGKVADAPTSRADLVVFVPEHVMLDARTESDRIEIKGLRSDVVASSASGDIWIRAVEGRVRAKTPRGRISVALETGATSLVQDFTTETGDIEVYVREDAAFSARLATSGEISTDFSLEIEHRRFEEPGKHAVAVVGEGGLELALASKRGRIRLLRLQSDLQVQGRQ